MSETAPSHRLEVVDDLARASQALSRIANRIDELASESEKNDYLQLDRWTERGRDIASYAPLIRRFRDSILKDLQAEVDEMAFDFGDPDWNPSKTRVLARSALRLYRAGFSIPEIVDLLDDNPLARRTSSAPRRTQDEKTDRRISAQVDRWRKLIERTPGYRPQHPRRRRKVPPAPSEETTPDAVSEAHRNDQRHGDARDDSVAAPSPIQRLD